MRPLLARTKELIPLEATAFAPLSGTGPEKLSGRAWIDPSNFHTLRVEMAVPNHRDNNGVLTLWTWSADYAPATFDDRQFWVPKTITSRSRGIGAGGSARLPIIAAISDVPLLWGSRPATR